MALGFPFSPDQFFLEKLYSPFLEEEDIERLTGGAVIYYFYHWRERKVMAYDSKREFKEQVKDHKRRGCLENRPLVHVMRLKDKRYLIKYHRFQCKTHPSSVDPLPAAMTGCYMRPYVIAETRLLDETQPIPADCKIEVDRTNLLSEWTNVSPAVNNNLYRNLLYVAAIILLLALFAMYSAW